MHQGSSFGQMLINKISMSRKSQFNIVLDRDTFFKGSEGSGDHILSGSLVFTPSSSIKINKISLRFEGKYDVSTVAEIRKSETIIFCKDWSFLSGNQSKLFKGGQTSTYNFTLALPRDLPESTKTDFGSIQYKFKAVVSTSLIHFNLKSEKLVFIQRYLDSLLTPRHITTLSHGWRDMLSCSFSIPSLLFTPGDELPLRLQYHITDDSKSARILLVACLLKQRIVYKSPKNPNLIIRDAEKKLDMTFVWFKEEYMNGEKMMTIKIPSSLKVYDTSNQYIEVTHRLQIRIDIGYRGKLDSTYCEFPILIASQRQDISEELPCYHTITPPPSYEAFLESNTYSSVEIPTFPPHYNSIISV
ncbi:hypothetical protein K7432_008277 [Basidiobolus ranarum]|uniref:Arrestin-like N-terminal domain-containing protein n=1 Tax=Basidiobolus ranarum TaxID=34480 RepID=A0ABR2WS68_9FUNG